MGEPKTMSFRTISTLLIMLTGLVLTALYGASRYIQAGHAYQIANHIQPKIQEGSFWLTINPQPFMIPGVVLLVVGLTLAIYDGVTTVNEVNKQRAEEAQQ